MAVLEHRLGIRGGAVWAAATIVLVGRQEPMPGSDALEQDADLSTLARVDPDSCPRGPKRVLVVERLGQIEWQIGTDAAIRCTSHDVPGRSALERESLCEDERAGEFDAGLCEGKTSRGTVSYTHLRAHETGRNLVCR